MSYVRKRSTRPVRRIADPSKVYKIRMERYGRGIRTDATKTREHIAWLLDLGLTIESISQAAGIGYTTVHKVRNGQTLVDGRIARAIRDVTWKPTDRQSVVLSIGARRRVEALVAMGYSQRWICEQIGVKDGNLRPTFFTKKRCVARHWIAVRDLYDAYAMKPGPSDRARRLAKKNGYAPPLAWDDDAIDDPHARPHTGTDPYGADVDDIVWLVRCGGTWDSISARLGIGRDAIDKSLRRAGRTDVIAELARGGSRNQWNGEVAS